MNPQTTNFFLVLTAFITALFFPLALFAILPVVFGIPHVWGDIRHLVLNRNLVNRPKLMLFAGIPVLAAGCGAGPIAAAPAALGASLAAHTSFQRRLLALALSCTFGVVIWKLGSRASLIFVYAHNLVGILIWFFWNPERCKQKLPLLILMITCMTFLFSPLANPLLLKSLSGGSFQNQNLGDTLKFMAPQLDPLLGARLIMFFCFTQILHYAVWLKWLDDESRLARATTQSPATKWMSLLILAASIGFAIWGLPQAWLARDVYLKIAAFHGYIEYAMLTLFLIEGFPKTS